jgi:hypothetical protein
VSKPFRPATEELEELVTGKGWCLATDRITMDGCRVGFMYRERPNDSDDSGWTFFAGDESDDYLKDPVNLAMYEVNTIANHDPAIIPLLDSPFMSAFHRAAESDEFTPVPFPESGVN